MSYTSLTANIDGLMSAVKLTWDASLGDATMFSQSIYYTDVYESGDGGLIHDNKVLDVAATDLSATITGLTSDRVYDFTIVGKTSVNDTGFEKDASANPHQLAGIPEFTLEKGNSKFTVTVSNHKDSTVSYILFINGNVSNNDKIRTIAKTQGTVTDGTWSIEISDGIENSTQGNKSFYEVSLRAINSVSTSAMSGSQTVEATNALPDVTGLEVLTGPERPANINSKAIVKFNAVPDATKYYIKAFAETKTLAEMIADATAEATADDDWFFTTNLFIHMNKNKQSGTELVEGTKYRFAVVPYGTSALSADSLAYVEATPSGKPVTTNFTLEGTTGKDISGGDGADSANHLTFAQMNGKYQVEWSVDTSANYLADGNGLPITALTFSLSGEDDEILKTKVVSGSDLSQNGFAMFEGLTNGHKYEVAVKTTNANGDSVLSSYTTSDKVVSTRPTNFTLIAGPAVGAKDEIKDGSLDISYNMNGNGLDVSHSDASPNFKFDLSGMDDTIGGPVNGIDLSLGGINALNTAVGNRYIIKARASNDNGDASPKELTAIVKPSRPPAVYQNDLSNASFAQSRIHIKETTDINKIIANFSNMVLKHNGYDVTGIRVRAVYDDSNNNGAAWTGNWNIVSVNDFSKDFEIDLPTITDISSAHTTYKLDVEPFNAVYTKDYQIVDDDLTINGGNDYGDVMKSGLQRHTTPSITVTNARLGITNLRMTSDPDAMDNTIKFKWRCDSAGTNIELCVAVGGLNDANTGYKVPTWSDYEVITDMSSTKFAVSSEGIESGEMLFDLSNGVADGILLKDNTYLKMEHARAYYFMVREQAHPGNEERAFGVSKTFPDVSDLSFSDYKSRDLITFTIDPKGAKLSSLFLLNNVNPTGDYFFNVLESGAVPSSTYEKLNTMVSGAINVAIQKDQFERNATAFPQNVLFHTLAGNSAGVTLGSSAATYANLNALGNEHPYDTAAKALEWAVKAEALADEAEALAATINGQAPANSHGVKKDGDSDAATPITSDADDKAAEVREHAKFARGASNDAARYAVEGRIYDKLAGNNKGDGKTALEQHDLAKLDLDALRLLSA